MIVASLNYHMEFTSLRPDRFKLVPRQICKIRRYYGAKALVECCHFLRAKAFATLNPTIYLLGSISAIRGESQGMNLPYCDFQSARGNTSHRPIGRQPSEALPPLRAKIVGSPQVLAALLPKIAISDQGYGARSPNRSKVRLPSQYPRNLE